MAHYNVQYMREAVLLLLAVVVPLRLGASDVAAEAARVLARNCVACHGAATQLSGLDLRTPEAMRKGGERGPALTPGQPEASRLYRLAAGLDQPAMPPGGKISAADLAALRAWIAAGAPPLPAAPGADQDGLRRKLEERPITEEERRYWAFQPPRRPPVPEAPAEFAAWAENPVDAFLLARMLPQGLRPSPPAGRRALIRRLYLDLLGLPPAPEDVEAFVADPAPDAWPKLVEQVLASPHYGERWGRHWLDLVRYSDSGGFEYDRDRPHAWRYRDYVVRSFNEDKPYPQFIREQIAGDEFAPDSPDALIATSFLRFGPDHNMKNEQTRMDELDDIVSTTTLAFLGMTVGCARCHNHKFDPIPQKDYYRMVAVFFSTVPVDRPLAAPDVIARHRARNQEIDGLQKPLKAERDALEKPYREQLLAAKRARLAPHIQQALRTPPEQRTEGQKLSALQVERTLRVKEEELVQAMAPADLARRKELELALQMLDARRPEPLPAAMAVGEEGRQAKPSYFLYRGSPGNKGSLMSPGVLSVAARVEPAFPEPPADSKSSWRRRAFAEWIASPDNPLTARVMVNRIWQHHFGAGIVRTPNNFGKSGARPSHPELLDWLATEFVRQGWSVKAMHRLMLNSQAYRMASDDTDANRGIDPENRWWWRMPRVRLEGEVVRDAMLAAAGTLDRSLGGPGVFPFIDPALWQSSSGRTWPGRALSDPVSHRRSLYIFHKRTIPYPMLEVFDKPDAAGSCPERNRSTVPTQALVLMNSEAVRRQAAFFAQRLQQERPGHPAAQVERAFALALARPPSPRERSLAESFLRSSPYGLVDFCQALFNTNEFAYAP